MNSIRHILFTVLFLGLSFAQDGFDNVDESTGWSYNNSGLRAYVFVSSILVDGVPSNPDNVIGAFRRTESDSLICVGFNSTNINGQTILILVGDDGSPSTSQYLQDGDVPEFKLYNSLTGVIVPMTYNDDIDLTYVNNQSYPDINFYADCIIPGSLDLIYTLDGNSIELSWAEPDGIDPISYYYVNDNSEQEVSSPLIIDNLDWESIQTFVISSSNVCGESFSQIEVEVGAAPLPEPIVIQNIFVEYNNVNIQWEMDENSYMYEVLRESEIIATVQQNYFTDPMLLANTLYTYKVRGINITGNASQDWVDIAPSQVLTEKISEVENIEVFAGDGRAHISWDSPDPYGELSYVYRIFLDEVLIKTTNLTSTYIPNLSTDTVYCLNVTASIFDPQNQELLIGESDQIEFTDQENCIEPEAPLGTELSWGIQVVSTFTEAFGSNENVDEYNMLGMSESASNESDYLDLQEPPIFTSDFSFYFEPSWDEQSNQYTQEIRTSSDLSDTTIVWDARSLNTGSVGDVSLTFYLIDNDGTFQDEDINVPYLYYSFDCDPTNSDGVFVRIQDGFTYDVGMIVPGSEQCYQIVVGNAIPEPPRNLTSASGYREIMISWEDGVNQNASSPQFSSTHYKVYRTGEDTEKSFITSDNFFIDRGLEPSALYSYKVAGINLAGEGPLSTSSSILYVDGTDSLFVQGTDYNQDGLLTVEDACYSTGIACETTKENRMPSSRAGIDLVFYNMDGSGVQNVVFPVSSFETGFGGWEFVSDENQSYDIDNYFLNDQLSLDLYNPLLDSLGYEWTSAENETIYTSSAVQTQLAVGEKGFQLKVNDNATSNSLTAIDSVFILVDEKPLPPSLTLDQVQLNPGLYSIDISWSASSFTGESYADLNLNGVRDGGEIYRDCGFDNLCSNEVGYIGSDFGEQDGIWNFEDLNGNGVWDGPSIDGLSESWIDSNQDGAYTEPEPFIDEQGDDGIFNGTYDSGLRPRPGYFGLPINNYSDKIASSYRIRRNGEQIAVIDSSSAPTLDGDLEEIFNFTDDKDFDGLEPSTEYCYTILSCHTNGEKCVESQAICATTQSKPEVSIVSHNESMILSSGVLDTIVLDLFNPQFIKHIDIRMSYNAVEFDQLIVSEDNIKSQYEVILNTQDGSLINRNVKLKVDITDIYDYKFDEDEPSANPSYQHISQSPFTISSTSSGKQFNSNWHLFGSPLKPFDESFDNSLNDSEVGFWFAYDQNLNFSDLSLEPGRGYYLNLLDTCSIEINGDVLSEYIINDLDLGWNLISNPLVVDVIKDSLVVIHEGYEYSWSEAVNQQLISGSLLGLNNEILTHEDSDVLEFFKGYWIHTNEENLSLKVKPHAPNNFNESNLDWHLNLFSRAGTLSTESFGDMITIGIDKDADNDFVYGQDDYHLDANPYISTFTKMYIHSHNGQQNVEIYKDIRKMNEDILFTWDVNGISNNISGQIKLSWKKSQIEALENLLNENAEGSTYKIVMQIGDQEVEMNESCEDGWCFDFLTKSEFSNFKIEVVLEGYIEGCMDVGACNYNEDANISNPSACTYADCSGCTDNTSVNFDPSAVINDGSCENTHSILIGYDLEKLEFNHPDQNNNQLQNIYINPLVQELMEIPIVLKKQNNDPIEVVNFAFVFDQNVFSFDHLQGNYANAIQLSSEVLDFNCYAVDATSPVALEDGSSMMSINWNLYALNCEDDVNAFINKPEDIVLGYFKGWVKNDQNLIGGSTTITLQDGAIDSQIGGETYTNSASYNIVDGLFGVEGLVSYFSDGSPVPGVNLDLTGISEIDNQQRDFFTQSIGLDQPNNTGKYYFENIFRGKEYILSPSLKSYTNCNDFPGLGESCGINAEDAAQIAIKTFGGGGFDTAFDSLAANVTLDTLSDGRQLITGFDASRVARYSVGLIPSLQKEARDILTYVSDEGETSIVEGVQAYLGYIAEGLGDNLYLDINSSGELVPFDEYNTDWIFVPGDLAFPTLIEDLSYKNFTAIRLGDVNGDLFNDDNLLRGDDEEITLNLLPQESIVKVPIKLSSEYMVRSVDLHINYNHDLLELESMEVNEDNLPQDMYSVVSNSIGYKDLVAIYAMAPVEDYSDGVLIDLYFRLTDQYYEEKSAIIDIDRILINGQKGAAGFLMDSSGKLYNSLVLGEPEEVHDFIFHPCYPNPFNPTVNIEFSLPKESEVKVDIFNARGQKVEQIHSGYSSKGLNKLVFNAKNLSSGVYFVKVSHLNNSTVQKILLLK